MPPPHVDDHDWRSTGPRGIGEVDDGTVRATVADGRLESLRLEPRLLRSGPDGLTPPIVEAVNRALADYREHEAAPDTPDIPAVDPDEVIADLRSSNEQYARETRQTMQFIQDVVGQLREVGVTVGELPTLTFDDLVDDLTESLTTVRDAAQRQEGAVTGQGEAPRGIVRAVCAPGARLTELRIEPAAARGTVELEASVVAAVNAALADLAANDTDQRATAGLDLPEIQRRLRGIREQNAARLESYFQSLTDVIRNIGT